MAKTIKFNLVCDEKPIRTLEGLRNNFSIEDIMIVYHNGLLKKWLTVRGYDKELLAMNEIVVTKDIEIIKILIKIFEIEVEDEKIEEDIYSLRYKNEMNIQIEEYKKNNFKVSSIISDYHSGYDSLIDTVIENKENMPKIKATMNEISMNYFPLFLLNHRELFNKLINDAPMAIFAMLMNEKMRSCFLIGEDENSVEKKNRILILSNIINDEEKIKKVLGDSLCSFAGHTEGYWKDVEPRGKKYMILKMELGNFVRSSGISGGDLKNDDVNEKFVILDGIDYKSNYSANKLLYMEV